MLIASDTDTYLGPATVADVAEGRVCVALPEGTRMWALSALGYPYQPSEGDTVLAVSRAEDCYIIGVLKATGPMCFAAPGDLELQAVGRTTLTAGEQVQVTSPTVRIAATRLEMFAQSVVETFGSAARWVKKTLHLRAGKVRNRVDGECSTRAGRITERAKGEVKIDGRKINLG